MHNSGLTAAEYVLKTVVPKMRESLVVYEHDFVADQSLNGFFSWLMVKAPLPTGADDYDSLKGTMSLCVLTACLAYHRSGPELETVDGEDRVTANLRWIVDEVGESHIDVDDFWTGYLYWSHIHADLFVESNHPDNYPTRVSMSLSELIGAVLNDTRQWTPSRICDWLEEKARKEPEAFSWYRFTD